MRKICFLAALSVLIVACSNTTSSDPAPLQLQEVVYGGCAGVFDMSEAALSRWDSGDPYGEPDTLIVTWDDTLKAFLGLNYICCAPFTADYELRQDTLVLTVRDTCPDPYTSCYCRCMCYYTFTWRFVDGEEEVHHLRVELVDPRVNGVEVLYQEELE